MIPLFFLALSYASALVCISSFTRRIDEYRETCYFLINRISQMGVERDRYRREAERLARRVDSLERQAFKAWKKRLRTQYKTYGVECRRPRPSDHIPDLLSNGTTRSASWRLLRYKFIQAARDAGHVPLPG